MLNRESPCAIGESDHMLGTKTTGSWVGLICDASSATVFAARGSGADAAPIAQRQLEYPAAQLRQSGRLQPLERFVADHQLTGCDVRVAFAGSGTIVQRLTLPPLSARNQLQAARTHLMNYADGRELALDIAREPGAVRRRGVRLVAAGVDLALGRAIHAACRRAGLRVRAMTALATAFGPATERGLLVQLILGERTTTIQLFDEGRLVASRDVLLGRRNFVRACQRPILTQRGPLTLGPDEADALLREVGIPVDREDEVRPGVFAAQLWPTLNPVLQKLTHEIGQSLSHSGWAHPGEAVVNVLGLPTPPGLGHFLATELQLRGVAPTAESTEASYLATFSGRGQVSRPLDLRPPERRFAARMTRPALAAGFCALLIIWANSVAPCRTEARLGELRPVVAHLRGQLERVREQRAEIRAAAEEPSTRLRHAGELLEALPASVPTLGPLKAVFRSVPPETELLDVTLNGTQDTARLVIRAACHGRVPASVLAARWGRTLSDCVFFTDAKVTSVSRSGAADPTVVEIEAELKGDAGGA
jgi:hypothetical protein